MSEDPAALATLAYRKLRQRDYPAALELFDRVVEEPEPNLRGLCNALYAVQHDNTGLGLMPERARRYLERAEPFGPKSPAIFYNGACVLAELGDTQCLHWIEAALQHGFEDPYQLYTEPLFAAVRGSEAFEAAFERHDGDRSIVGTPEAKRVQAFAADVAQPGDGLLEALEIALRHPPTRAQTIGFYSGRHAQSNAFLFLVTQLDKRGRILSAEDKYCPEVFEQFAKAVALPDAFTRVLADVEKSSAEAVAAGYVEAVQALEDAFERAGTPLRTLWTGGGDTVSFIATTPAVAQTWTGRALVRKKDGAPLGLCMPAWDTFFEHLGYAMGWPRELEVPPGIAARVWDDG